jgi:ATP-binding cassette subfamily C protein
VVVITHRPSALAAVDKVIVIASGQIQAFGPKDEVLKKTTQSPPATPQAIRLMAAAGEMAQ